MLLPLHVPVVVGEVTSVYMLICVYDDGGWL